jgi:hypothetical protein
MIPIQGNAAEANPLATDSVGITRSHRRGSLRTPRIAPGPRSGMALQQFRGTDPAVEAAATLDPLNMSDRSIRWLHDDLVGLVANGGRDPSSADRLPERLTADRAPVPEEFFREIDRSRWRRGLRPAWVTMRIRIPRRRGRRASSRHPAGARLARARWARGSTAVQGRHSDVNQSRGTDKLPSGLNGT